LIRTASDVVEGGARWPSARRVAFVAAARAEQADLAEEVRPP